MKNFKLLLATTAILSTTLAMNVKSADNLSPTIYAKAHLIKPITISSDPEQALDFGFLKFEAEKYIEVDTNGAVVTANTNADYYGFDKQSAAHLVISGGLNIMEADGTVPSKPIDMTKEMKEIATWNISNINLLSSNDQPCGTVSNFEKSYVLTDNGIEVYIGGKFTMTDENITIPSSGLSCTGSTVATLILNFD